MSETAKADERHNNWILKVLGVELPGTGPDIFDPAEKEDYRAYLLRALQQLRIAGTANFAIAFGAKPYQHRMALARQQSPRALSSRLMSRTGLHTATWGVAEPHPERKATLLLTLEGHALVGLKKKGEQMLRLYQPLPMRRIAPWLDGVELEDPADDSDLAAGEDDAAADYESILETLPEELPPLTSRAQTLITAAEHGRALIEECPLPSPRSTRIED